MIKKVLMFFAVVSTFSFFAFSNFALAEDVFSDVCSQPGASDSTACKSKNIGNKNPIFGPEGVMTSVINIVSILVGVIAFIMILIGGFKLIMSGSNPQDVGKARETIIYAIVGLIIAALAQVIVQFVLKRIN